jgi:hypothetical protein
MLKQMSDNHLGRLTDKDIIPTEELIFSIIGYNKVFWQRIMKYASENYNDISGSWNYYDDGKKWLFKLSHKKKNLLWAGILNDTFRVTFWFADKAEPLIEAAILPPAMKDEFRNARKYGSVRPLSIVVKEQSDADNVITLITLKYQIK